MSKSIRFASLIRVSTEEQEKKGASLTTQRAANERDAQLLGGTVVALYGGQEHGTPGWEKAEVDRLIADAARHRFDAVIVAYADRWTRDNQKSSEGLDAFKQAGIRFFISTTEYDLFNPEHLLFLNLSASIGQFLAHNQTKKSLLNRIAIAREGRPAGGALPFGRTYDRETKTWGIDAAKLRMVEDVARRYLAGESLAKLAEEYGVNCPNLHKILTRRAGTTWVQEFVSRQLNIHETIETAVPRLLPEETIAAIRSRCEAGRTWLHGQTHNRYLLGRMVLCGHCGYAMTGETKASGNRYYRHTTQSRCGKRGSARADELETAVMQTLFDTFGNPLAVQRAIEEALPNRDQVMEHLERKTRLEGELQVLQAGRDRILRLIGKGLVTEEQAEKQLAELAGRERRRLDELDVLRKHLAGTPPPEEIQALAAKVAGLFGKRKAKRGRPRTNPRLWARIMLANGDLDRMTWDDQRALCQLVFGGKTADGKRMGVYLTWSGTSLQFKAVGKLINQWGISPAGDDYQPAGATQQTAILTELTKSARYSSGIRRRG